MIGLKQLASLLAGAIVLFGSVLVPAGEQGTVAIETIEGDVTRAVADGPATIDLGQMHAYDVVTSKGAPAPPASLEGGFQTVHFVASTTNGPTTATLGDKDVAIPAGAEVLVEGLTGTLIVQEAEQGVQLSIAGTASGLEVDPPSDPAVETSSSDQQSIPVKDVSLDDRNLTGSLEQAGEFGAIEFTVVPGEDDADIPLLNEGDSILPFDQTVRVRIGNYVGLVIVLEAEEESYTLRLDGYGQVTVLDQSFERRIQQNTDIDIGDVNGEPEANFSHNPPDPEAQETVHFQTEDSSDVTVQSWEWEFGDGTTSQARQPEHVYERSGTYEVRLTVEDLLGRSDTQAKNVTVVNSRPVVSLAWEPTKVIEGENVELIANAHDRDGDIVSYDWSIPNRTDPKGPSVNHTFPERGNYDVGLVVTDTEGAQADTLKTLSVVNAPPEASFEADPTEPIARETVFLESTSTDYRDGEIVNHTWEVPNVGIRYGELIKVAFPKDGPQNVTLTVRDDDGGTDTVSEHVPVRNAPPEVSVRISPQPINPGVDVDFVAQVKDDDAIEKVRWEFSDGLLDHGLRATRTFATGGAYDVSLRVQDSDGAWGSTNRSFEVNHAPSVELGPLDRDATDKLAIQTLEDVTINARVDDPDSQEVHLSWDVDGDDPKESSHCLDAPDGNDSRIRCSWPDDGRHMIRIKARDDDGAISRAKMTLLVLNRAPVLNPSILTGTVNVGETVRIDANAEDLDGTVEETLWKIEGELVQTGPSLTHRFEEPGPHETLIVATDNDGAIETSNFQVDVNAPPMIESVSAPDEPLAGESASFSAQATDPDGNDANLTHVWDFGDGATAMGANVAHTFEEGGSYWVQLTVTDEKGATDHDAFRLDVDTPPLDAELSIDPKPPMTDEQVTFTLDVREGREIEEIRWSFGDGTSVTTGSGVQTMTHTYDTSQTYRVGLDIQADHGQERRLSTFLRVTAPVDHHLIFEPRLPNGQCLNLDANNLEFRATNLATAKTIALANGDAFWETTDPCRVEYTFTAGSWAIGDQLATRIELDNARTTRTFTFQDGTSMIDLDLRLRHAPLSFDRLELVSPGQSDQGEDQRRYHDTTRPVYATGEIRWADGTMAKDVAFGLAATYRGADSLDAPSLTYFDDQARVPDNGTFFERVPAPVIGSDSGEPYADAGPSLTYLPGQYRVKLTATSGVFGDMQTASFLEDPVGILQTADELG